MLIKILIIIFTIIVPVLAGPITKQTDKLINKIKVK